MHRWRYPSLSLHGIEGAFSEAGAKTVIPRKVIGKFSIRLVPDMDPKVVEKQVDTETSSRRLSLTLTQTLLTFESQNHNKLCDGTETPQFKFPKISFVFVIIKVLDYLQQKFAELGSPNKLKVHMGHGAKAWVSDFNHPHYMAGRKAMKTGTEPE